MSMSAKTVYLIATGEDEDYRVIGVFDDLSGAEKCMARIGGSTEDIEEWALNESTVSMEYDVWQIRMQENGDVQGARSLGAASVDSKTRHYWTDWYVAESVRTPMAKWEHQETPLLIVDAVARAEEHAIKIASEIRRQILAENSWGITK